jgi:hypothetical protein
MAKKTTISLIDAIFLHLIRSMAGGLGPDAPKTTPRVPVLSEVEGSLALGDRGDSGPQLTYRLFDGSLGKFSVNLCY